MSFKKCVLGAKVVSAAGLLVVVSGCNWFGGSSQDSGAPTSSGSGVSTTTAARGPKIVEFKNGKVLTMGDVDSEIAKVLAANPYTKAMDVSQLTPDMKEMFFKDMLNRKLVEMYADDNNVENSAKFKEDLEQTYKLLVQAKKGEWFSEQVRAKAGKTISDSDVKKAYEKNKSRYVKSAGGVRTAAVRFSSKDEAKEFFVMIDPASVSKVKDFEELSRRAEMGKYRDFGRISEESPRGASGALVDEAMSRRSFPSVEIVRAGDDEYWVAFFEDSKEAVYFAFDEVKDQIRSMIEGEKFNEIVEAEVKNLEAKYVKNIDASAFKVAGAMPAADE